MLSIVFAKSYEKVVEDEMLLPLGMTEDYGTAVDQEVL